MDLPSDLIGLAWSQIWQVTLLLAVVGILTRVFCRRRPHLAYLLWMLVVLKCLTPPVWSSPTGLFSWAQARSVAPIVESPAIGVADGVVLNARPGASIERMLHGGKRSVSDSTSKAAAGAAVGVREVESASVSVVEPSRRWVVSWQAVVAAIWMGGVLTLGGVLLWKWLAFGRVLRRSGRPADAELELLAARVGERLGLRRAVGVRIVSESIGPAVFGLWRPVVVIPEAVVRDKTPQQIEPILAHELAHVRRGDAFAGLLQMIAQVVWWFHPLVWWASREMCRRREQCCDEEVVAGLGCSSAVYARCLVDVLEWECCRGRRRLLSVVPGVGSAEITTTRLEHIMDDTKRFHRRTPRWMWGVLTLALALVLPGREMVLGQNSEALSTKDTKGTKEVREGKEEKGNEGKADRVPTPAEIAEANDATWDAIGTMDMEYTQTSRYMYNVMGDKRWIEDTVMGRWLKAGNQERLKRSSKHDYFDYYIDDVAERQLSEPHRKEADYGRFSPVDVTDVDGRIYPAKSRILARRVFFQPSPEVLRYFYLHHGDFQGDRPLTLAEVCATWKVTVKGKRLSAAGDTLWLLHANYPGKYHNSADSYIDFHVNANKGFLIEKAFIYESNSCIVDGKTVGRCHAIEIKEYQALGGGVFFPKRMEYRKQVGVERAEQISADKCDWSTWTVTKLTLNAPLASDAFDFRFPAGVTVYENDKGPNEYKVYIWGPDNKPAQKFATEREYVKWAESRELEKQRKQIEKKLASKDPKDIEERCIYYRDAKKFDEAITSLSELIALDRGPSEKMQALYSRGFIFLIYRSNSAKAIDDFSEAIRLVKNDAKSSAEDIASLKVYRALAYAQQDETLDKALADLADIRPPANGGDGKNEWHDDVDWWQRLACLLRAAIRIHQAKMKSGDVVTAQIYQDITSGYLVQLSPGGQPFSDGYAMLGYVMARDSDPKNAVAAGEIMKKAAQIRELQKKHPPRDVGDDVLDLIDAYHRCLVRLVPEIEKGP